MKIEDVAFTTVDWEKVAAVAYPGTVGEALWRTVEAGNVRVRIVEYSPGYIADHWCQRGHVVMVLEGELITELEDGREFVLTVGASYHVADGASSHRSRSPKGAKLFIVD